MKKAAGIAVDLCCFAIGFFLGGKALVGLTNSYKRRSDVEHAHNTICKVITVAGMMPDEILFAGWGDCERLGEDLSQNPLSDAPVIVCTVDLG